MVDFLVVAKVGLKAVLMAEKTVGKRAVDSEVLWAARTVVAWVEQLADKMDPLMVELKVEGTVALKVLTMVASSVVDWVELKVDWRVERLVEEKVGLMAAETVVVTADLTVALRVVQWVE